MHRSILLRSFLKSTEQEPGRFLVLLLMLPKIKNLGIVESLKSNE